MRILLATTEAVPYAKTGGLGDVCGSLPVELDHLGHQVTLIMPAFRQVFQAGLPIEETGLRLDIPIGSKHVFGTLLRGRLPGSSVPVYFVRNDSYYDRPELYREAGEDYRDNCERFVFFCRAVIETIRLLELDLDVVHAHDWPAGLIPAYLKIECRGLPRYESVGSLLTIHNLAYQGNFWHWDMALTGLDWKYFNWRQMEFYGNLNLLKTGLAFSDVISTVSPRYAEEIQSAPLGCGLEGMLTHRRGDLFGVINGIDYRQWNPATDPHLAARYDVTSYRQGKAACKQALCRDLNLSYQPQTPLVAMVGRLIEQKGVDLVAQVMREWLPISPVQWVILGTGEPKYHELFGQLAERHPGKVVVRTEFSERLAHQIEAGADIFLMPSRYEPCGLNQLYSLKYGTVPVVRATGGLADTIVGATEASIAAQTANGFSFRDYSALALSETLHKACDAYGQPGLWNQLVTTGMEQDWSWAHSAREYSRLYETTVARHRIHTKV